MQAFFVERVFEIFDKDGNGSISLQEFIESMNQFTNQTPDEKLKFVFQVFDLDGLYQKLGRKNFNEDIFNL